MKKLLFLLITLCTSLSMAQSFIITKDGFVNEDTNQDFVVIESNGKSQKGMFEAVKSGINKVLLNPEIEKIEETEYSTISVVAVNKIRHSNFLSFRYKIEFSFKDNAVKIQITYIDIIGYKKVMYFKKESGKEYDKNISFLVKENGKIRSYERGLLEDFSDDIISETKRAIKQAW
ncbi:hypothetical protein [Capnocytophaga sputigena]|uniref:hypothetical protein n=1 Tax=Capnocytophaga sputigena TaxID=1019 RepID=UPI002889BE25|nr:hypothetical protein [Capnocytophaga sputigena]